MMVNKKEIKMGQLIKITEKQSGKEEGERYPSLPSASGIKVVTSVQKDTFHVYDIAHEESQHFTVPEGMETLLHPSFWDVEILGG